MPQTRAQWKSLKRSKSTAGLVQRDRGDVLRLQSWRCHACNPKASAAIVHDVMPCMEIMGLQGKPVPIGILQSHLGIELSGGGKANPRSK